MRGFAAYADERRWMFMRRRQSFQHLGALKLLEIACGADPRDLRPSA